MDAHLTGELAKYQDLHKNAETRLQQEARVAQDKDSVIRQLEGESSNLININK